MSFIISLPDQILLYFLLQFALSLRRLSIKNQPILYALTIDKVHTVVTKKSLIGR